MKWHTKCLSMCYFTCQALKNYNSLPCHFNLISYSRPRWRPLLVTSQVSSSATTNKVYLILLRRSKAFHWRQNRFEILQIWKRLWGGVPSTTPQPLYHGWGMNLRVRPRVKWRLGHSNLGYINSYKLIPLKASCWKSIAFFAGCVTSFHL